MKQFFVGVGLIAVLALFNGGCSSSMGNEGNISTYKIVNPEPDWIRNGEPLEFESELWYPRDSLDILLDSEVMVVGDFRGLQIFIQAVDVRPYNRVFTKFGKNKFRVFETKTKNDQSKKAF